MNASIKYVFTAMKAAIIPVKSQLGLLVGSSVLIDVDGFDRSSSRCYNVALTEQQWKIILGQGRKMR